MVVTLDPLQERWQELAAHFAGVTDELGRPLDAGIFDTVVALNALGLSTTASCEGHVEEGDGGPVVHLEPPEVAPLRAAIEEVEQQIVPGHSSPAVDELERLMREAHARQIELRWRVLHLLEAFYVTHQTTCERRLILVSHEWLGETRLESQGTSLQEAADPETRRQKLAEYQEEMRAFTAFLKQRYFGAGEMAAEQAPSGANLTALPPPAPHPVFSSSTQG